MNVALAIIQDEDKVLIGKIRSEKINDYGGLLYVFPCEDVQNENSAEEELIKEVKRQTNLDIKIIQKIGERIHPLTKNYTYYFHCQTNSGQTTTVPKEIDVESFIWSDIDNLHDYMPTLFEVVWDYPNKNS